MRAIFKSAKIGKNTRCKQQFAYDDAADLIRGGAVDNT